MANGFLPQETPQEILARLAQQRRTDAGNDPQSQRLANQENALDVLFGNPEAQRAKGIQDAVRSAGDNFTEDESKSGLENEIARLRSIRDSVEDVDTNTFMKVNERLLELSIAQEEQSRLQAGETRAQDKAEREKREFTSGAEDRNVYMVVDPATGMAVDNVDLRTDEGIAKLRELQTQNPEFAIQKQDEFLSDRAADRQALNRIDAANARRGTDRSDIGATTRKNELSRESKANVRMAIGVGDLLDLAVQSPAAFGLGGAAVSGVNKIGAHARSFMQAVNPEAFAEDRSKAEEILLRNNIAEGQKKSLILDLAYAIASSREGGRLTDQDVERAIQTLGGDQPDPRAFASVLIGLTNRSANLWEDRLRTAGLSNNEQAQEMHAVAQERFNDLQPRMQAIREELGITDEDAAAYLNQGVKSWDETVSSFDEPGSTAAPGTEENPLDFFRSQ